MSLPEPVHMRDRDGREIVIRAVGGGAEGMVPGDEQFVCHGVGFYNVGKIRRAIAAEPDQFPLGIQPIVPALVDHLGLKHDPDFAHIERLTAAEVDSPGRYAIGIVLRWAGREPVVQLVDGTHYILKRYFLGRADFRLRVVPKADTKRFKFELLRRRADIERDKWRPISPLEYLSNTWGTYHAPDGAIRDARGAELMPAGTARRTS